MVSRARNTLDGHAEVNHEKSYTGLSTNIHVKVTIKPHPLQLTRLVVKVIPYNKWSLAYLLDYTMAVNHGRVV